MRTNTCEREKMEGDHEVILFLLSTLFFNFQNSHVRVGRHVDIVQLAYVRSYILNIHPKLTTYILIQ